jgi:hypothetical protein
MRMTPRHIDKKNRIFDYFIVGVGPFFLFHTISLALALLTGPVLVVIYTRYTLDKPDGFILHMLHKSGVSLRGLIPTKIRRLSP